MLKSPTVIVDLSVSPGISISFCFMYCEALWFGYYTFRIIMSFWWIINPPFIIVGCPSLPLAVFFALEFSLLDMNLDNPAFKK